MKKGFRSIIYIVIFLIAAGGLTLLLMRKQAVQYLSDNAGFIQIESPKRFASSSKDTLDIGIFTNTKFVILKNNVSKFDFETICKTPVGRVTTTATSSDGTVTTSIKSVSCSLGNGIPFPVPPKTKEN